MPSTDTSEPTATLTRGGETLPVAVRAVPRVPGGRVVWHLFVKSLRGAKPQPGDVLTVDNVPYTVTAVKPGGVGQFLVLNCGVES
ncbi:unnamed protein product [Gemmataceae bacterium]|nr:unnamed protein product [Gemmataceae bacterium]VTT98869.1 unnamed protein product [Gemmataceae bacterium]